MSKYSGSKKPVKLLTSRFLRNNPKQFWKQLNWFGLSQMVINKIKAKAIFPCKKNKDPAVEWKLEYQLYISEIFCRKDSKIFDRGYFIFYYLEYEKEKKLKNYTRSKSKKKNNK